MEQNGDAGDGRYGDQQRIARLLRALASPESPEKIRNSQQSCPAPWRQGVRLSAQTSLAVVISNQNQKSTMKMLAILLACVLCAGSSLTSAPAAPAKVYVCPACGCPDDNRTFDKPGNCPSCGMKLVEKEDKQQQQGMTVAILLFDGAEVIDYAGPWEVFGQAGFKVFTVAENSKPIVAVFGQKVTPDYTFSNAPAADVLLVPGGSGGRAAENPAVVKWVQQSSQTSKYVMSVCTGAFILAKAGLLDGLGATTVQGGIDRLARVATKTHVVSDQRYVDNGKVITTAGLSSGIDGALHLVAKIKSQGFARATALGLEYNWDPNGKFVRAALADRFLPQINELDGEVLSADGDLDHWRAQALISKPDSVAAILDLLGKHVAENTPHAQGAVVVEGASNGTGEHAPALQWNFTGDDGRRWTGRALVERSTEKPEKFVLSLKLDSQLKPNQL